MKSPNKIYLQKEYPQNGILPNGVDYEKTDENIEYDESRYEITVSVENDGNSLKATATPTTPAAARMEVTSTPKIRRMIVAISVLLACVRV